MATKTSQRIGIWIIAIVLAVGTLASFIAFAIGIDSSSQTDTQVENKIPLVGYNASTFDASSVKVLKVDFIKQGEGDVIKATDSINVSYFGWTSDGKIFDSSQQTPTQDSPIDLSLSSVISGWTEGLTGQKVGSVVKLNIPSEKAYGAQAFPGIPANSPLVFIVEIHKIVETAAEV